MLLRDTVETKEHEGKQSRSKETAACTMIYLPEALSYPPAFYSKL
jgi:hypothetical protein